MPIKDRETLRTLSKNINFILSFSFWNFKIAIDSPSRIDFPEEYLELREINFDTWLHIF